MAPTLRVDGHYANKYINARDHTLHWDYEGKNKVPRETSWVRVSILEKQQLRKPGWYGGGEG
jgi:predicted 2-oxoglutarate/Fe(II)-dependent dioxygenase YbiX